MKENTFIFKGIDKKSNILSIILEIIFIFIVCVLCFIPLAYFYGNYLSHMNMYMATGFVISLVIISTFIYLKLIAPKFVKEWKIVIDEQNNISIFFNRKNIISSKISEIIKIKYVKTNDKITGQKDIFIDINNSKIRIQ